MAFSHVGSSVNKADTSATTIAVTRTGVSAGNLLAVWIKHEGAATTITVSDGTSTFTAATKTSHGNGDVHGQWHYLLSSVASGSVTYTATFGATRPYRSILLFEADYTDTASFDVEATAQGSGTNPSSGNLTTTGTDEIVYGGYGEYASVTTSAYEVNNLAADVNIPANAAPGLNYTAAWGRIFTSTFSGPADVTIDSSSAWVCNAIAFKAGAAPAGRTTRNTHMRALGMSLGMALGMDAA